VEGEAAGCHLVVAPVDYGKGRAGQRGIGHADYRGQVDAPGRVYAGDGEVAGDGYVASEIGGAFYFERAVGGDVAGLVKIGTAIGRAAVSAADAQFFEVTGVIAEAYRHGCAPWLVIMVSNKQDEAFTFF